MSEGIPPAVGNDDVSEVASGGSDSAGEFGEAESGATDAGQPEVIVGEIPDVHDTTKMLWTATCLLPSHGLLGTVDSQMEAERLKDSHLLSEHGPSL
jgi:hypothetical protein